MRLADTSTFPYVGRLQCKGDSQECIIGRNFKVKEEANMEINNVYVVESIVY